jgi:hypothetical protein
VGIAAVEMVVGGAVFVVVALDAGKVHVADDLETFLGVGVVADDIAEADDMRGALGANVLQHDLKSLQVAVDVSDDGVFHLLPDDFKTLKFIFRNGPSYLFVANKSSKTCGAEGGAKGVEFGADALGDEFDAAVGKVADDAGDFKAGGDGSGGVTKADALHITGVKHGHAAAGGIVGGRRHRRIKPNPWPGSNQNCCPTGRPGGRISIASNVRRVKLSTNKMKTFLVAVLASLAVFRAAAQVDVQLAMDQEQFLPGESVPVAVKITNRSGQTLHLGAEANWLTFSVEADDGFVVIKNADVPVVGPFDLESSQMAIKRVDLQPYFVLNNEGRYKVTAVLRIKDKNWNATEASAPKSFDVVNGAILWSQEFGLPSATGSPPEMRRYTLEEANYLRSQLRLYVRVSDASKTINYKVAALGPMASFSQTEAKVDPLSRLHVLWQAGAHSFKYAIVSPTGAVVRQDTYDNLISRPRLTVTDTGDVAVVGGTRQIHPSEMPAAVFSPDELPSTPVAPAKP